jgi:hypothetical protein
MTMNRLAVTQLCPALPNRERAAAVAARAMSASSSTTNGSEPPSSSTVFFSAAPAACAIAAPARSLPVRVTAAIRGSATIRAETSGTRPASMTSDRNSPAGAPASVNSASIASAQPVTSGLCLSRAALPAARAAHANRSTCQNGKFHGITAKITPSGS